MRFVSAHFSEYISHQTKKRVRKPATKKMEFKQMVARLAKIPEAGEYLAYFPDSGIERNAANAA